MFVVLVVLAVDEFFRWPSFGWAMAMDFQRADGRRGSCSRSPRETHEAMPDLGFSFSVASQVILHWQYLAIIFNRATHCPTRKWHNMTVRWRRTEYVLSNASMPFQTLATCKWNVWPVGMPATRCTLLLSVWQPVECTSLGSSMLDFTNGMCTHKPCTLQDATFASKFQVPHHHTERWQPCHTSYVAILSDTSCPSTSEFKPWNSDGTGNVQWGGCVCFNLATKQCEVPVLKTKLHLPLSSFGLQSMS